jgi:hypothetical protein
MRDQEQAEIRRDFMVTPTPSPKIIRVPATCSEKCWCGGRKK